MEINLSPYVLVLGRVKRREVTELHFRCFDTASEAAPQRHPKEYMQSYLTRVHGRPLGTRTRSPLLRKYRGIPQPSLPYR